MYHNLALFTVELSISKLGKSIYSFFNSKYYYDAIVNHYIILPSLSLGLITSKILDRGAIEIIGPHGLTTTLYKSSSQINRLDTGIVTQYSLYMILALISLAIFLFLPLLTGSSLGDIRILFVYVAALFALAR